ncbi:MAG: hypothetical protein M1817_005792 [Caeruleum heppii]|nr:MAG: hypothetical protein M1817_005792 [Caeruleum heppii]
MPAGSSPQINGHGNDRDPFNHATSFRVFTNDRPWLLSSNRKLRHVQGIALRNLSFSPTPKRSRRQTIDDESLPQTWKSPTKLLAQRESQGRLEHSKSSVDISRSSAQSPTSERNSRTGAASGNGEIRPSLGKIRRRSTLNWAGASATTRQKKLEDVVAERMADTWFSLHVEGEEEPIYVSEVVSEAMNPGFQAFDLSDCGPRVTRLQDLTVKIWAKSGTMDDYKLLLQLELSLRSMRYIGKSLGGCRHPFPANTVIFNLLDGLYTNFTDTPMDEPPMPAALVAPKAISHEVRPTSSYDALMLLSTLDDCIQDALATREKLALQIDSILQENAAASKVKTDVGKVHESLSVARQRVNVQKRILKAAVTQRAELKTSLETRRKEMQQGRESQESAKERLREEQTKVQEHREMIRTTGDDIQGQGRRICEDLMEIFPIEPVSAAAISHLRKVSADIEGPQISNKPLNFTICGLHLPNSTFSHTDIDEATIAAALGHVAHLVQLLSSYLSTPLPYPVTPFASSSSIRDPISLMPSGQRTFSLSPHDGPRYRFDYAVFLLNKDIELLTARQGIKVLDLRHTLPNLKYLLYYIASAGAHGQELPLRKVGGIRGLLDLRARPSFLRRDSEESASTEGATAGVEARALVQSEGRERKGVTGLVVGNGKAVKGGGSRARSPLSPRPAVGRGAVVSTS